jgi:hypothetical protein
VVPVRFFDLVVFMETLEPYLRGSTLEPPYMFEIGADGVTLSGTSARGPAEISITWDLLDRANPEICAMNVSVTVVELLNSEVRPLGYSLRYLS